MFPDPEPAPPGFPVRASERLLSGRATGALALRDEAAAGHARLRVKVGPRGRGLFALTSFAAGESIAHMDGTLHEGDSWPEGDAREVLHLRNPRPGCPGAWLLLNAASSRELGNLVNTAGSGGGNNARFVVDKRRLRVTVRATKPVQAGDEVLAAYGKSYTAALCARGAPAVQAQPVGRGFGRVTCPDCHKEVSRGLLKRHRARFGHAQTPAG